MLISTLDDVEFAPEYPELAGRRILVSGVAGAVGIDVVRAFAEAGARLIVQAVEDSPETLAMAEIIAPHAMDVHLVTGPSREPRPCCASRGMPRKGSAGWIA